MALPEHYRYERKFVVVDRGHSFVELLVRLHPAIFRREYPSRFVNNIYLDSLGLANFRRHVDGTADRSKIRIRWYDELYGLVQRPVLELKIKSGYVGRKERHALPSFAFNGHFDRQALLRLTDQANVSDEIRQRLMALHPCLVNRYHRTYFRAAGTSARLTLDSELTFYPTQPRASTFGGPFVDRRNTILELKYDSADAPLVEALIEGFPFRVEKFSKYVFGMQRLNGLEE